MNNRGAETAIILPSHWRLRRTPYDANIYASLVASCKGRVAAMLFFLVALIFWLGLAFLGASMASTRHRSAVGWFFVCLIVPFLGLLLLLILPDANAPHQVVIVERESANSSGDHTAHSVSPTTAHPAAQASAAGSAQNSGNGYPNGHTAPVALNGADMLQLPKPEPLEQWRYLVEYDPAICAAASALGPLGPDAQAALREAFFALQDRALLPAIVARIQQRGGVGLTLGAHQQAIRAESAPRNLPLSGPRNGADIHPLPLARTNGASNNNASHGYNGNGHSDGQPNGGAYAISGGSPARNGHGEGYRNGSTVNGAAANGVVANGAHASVMLTGQANGQASGRPHQSAPIAALRSAVSPQDLAGATFLETYRGVHLFQLSDGRIYIDRHVGMPTLAHARQLIDEARAMPQRPTSQPAAVTSTPSTAPPTALRA